MFNKRTLEDSGKPPGFPVAVQRPRRVSVTFGACEIYNVGSEEEVEASHFATWSRSSRAGGTLGS